MLERSLMTKRYEVPPFSFVTFLPCIVSPIVKPGPTVSCHLPPCVMSSCSSPGSDGLILEGRDCDSHRGDPRLYDPGCGCPLSGSAMSVDVEHGLAADAALQEGGERSGSLAPRDFELDLAVQSPVGHERAEASEVAGPAGVGGELVREVQRVDPRPLRPLEPRRLEGDGLVVALGRDVDDDSTRSDVLDGKAERGPPDSVDDQIEVAGEGLDDVGRAEPAKELLRRDRVAHQCGDVGAALAGELDRDPPDAAGGARDQHALAEYEAADLERPQRRQTCRGQRGGLRV